MKTKEEKVKANDWIVHLPVLKEEVIVHLNLKPGMFVIDGTADGGGHSLAILEKISPGGTLLMVDWDENLLKYAQSRLKEKKELLSSNRVIAVVENYARIPQILREYRLPKAEGLILDLGFSSFHLEQSERGFSFQRDEKLDMRYSTTENLATAAEVLNQLSERKLAEIFYRYGQERFSRQIAKSIVLYRRKKQIETTAQLLEIIDHSLPAREKFKRKIHPATKIFQALRIYVNRELENLESILKKLPAIIKSKGRCLIISFHSLEDRLVKNYFRYWQKEKKALVVNKKVIRPSFLERKQNPRSRSAKLRVLEII
ncbi:MAG: 16S rRNA (cytosine(1402)-N(4))-methyltransferase RsmH [Patescibacteria group bacterium]|nr:16S rRNA (cytosine(1402)-N(4))-methyltransferase RsmH [Patescibacteria group bacterium]